MDALKSAADIKPKISNTKNSNLENNNNEELKNFRTLASSRIKSSSSRISNSSSIFKSDFQNSRNEKNEIFSERVRINEVKQLNNNINNFKNNNKKVIHNFDNINTNNFIAHLINKRKFSATFSNFFRKSNKNQTKIRNNINDKSSTVRDAFLQSNNSSMNNNVIEFMNSNGIFTYFFF